MKPTWRFWETLAVSFVPALVALLFGEPLLLIGSAGIISWLLAAQLGFVIAVNQLHESLEIHQILDHSATYIDETVSVVLAPVAAETQLDVTVTARPSRALESDGIRETQLGESTTFLVRSSVAGTHQLQQPELHVTDPFGLFTEQFRRGEKIKLRVETRPLTDIHIGQGGTVLTNTVGKHRFDRDGAGVVPSELREYEAGESASQIDWKTTARRDDTYVRGFEAEVAQPILLIFDARSGLNTGSDSMQPLDYLRTAADAFVTSAEQLGDPLGCYGIDDQGARQLTRLSAAKRDYEQTKKRLQDITSSSPYRRNRQSPSLRHRVATYDNETRFDNVLHSYTVAKPALDPESHPLKAAVRIALAKRNSAAHVAIFTDDTDRTGIRDAIAEAQRTGKVNSVSVFMTPGALFDGGSSTAVLGPSDRYVDFEQFRRDLTRITDVRAYEIGPEDRFKTNVPTNELI